jgi:hypothetical protein
MAKPAANGLLKLRSCEPVPATAKVLAKSIRQQSQHAPANVPAKTWRSRPLKWTKFPNGFTANTWRYVSDFVAEKYGTDSVMAAAITIGNPPTRYDHDYQPILNTDSGAPHTKVIAASVSLGRPTRAITETPATSRLEGQTRTIGRTPGGGATTVTASINVHICQQHPPSGV